MGHFVLAERGIKMEEQFIEAVDKAIEQVVLDFQGNPSRYWNERDIHWNLFHHLKQQGLF